ncbi:MAG: hypothetical protein FJY92_02885, partial [Candidatus Hydrogenedentes bacterium]|nr:hypothetical protein [Candidatus Hydrogenedentota bacterium]
MTPQDRVIPKGFRRAAQGWPGGVARFARWRRAYPGYRPTPHAVNPERVAAVRGVVPCACSITTPTPGGHAMSQSLSAIFIHATWSTKERAPFLGDASHRARMHEYLGGASNTLGCSPIIVGGIDDHVHVLARVARTESVADWVKEMKRVSSAWAKDLDPALRRFQWQAGYGA